eukprot:141743-Hanusia_phi.AAC.1
MRVGSKEGAEQLLEVLPLSFTWQGRSKSLEQSIEFELERITMECCSTTGDRHCQGGGACKEGASGAEHRVRARWSAAQGLETGRSSWSASLKEWWRRL